MPSRILAPRGIKKSAVGLIFAESQNDADALSHLARAIWEEAPVMRYRRKPLVLIRDRQAAEARRKNAEDIARVIRAECVQSDVKLVIAHKDCDNVEPADQAMVAAIRSAMEGAGIGGVVAVAPAWETEAWWFMWPEAVAAVHSKWTPLTRGGNHGRIRNAKEVLRRELRSVRTQREYEESDSNAIAKNVLTLGLIDRRRGSCSSFDEFRRQIRRLAGILE